jgi:hypothetical protein
MINKVSELTTVMIHSACTSSFLFQCEDDIEVSSNDPVLFSYQSTKGREAAKKKVFFLVILGSISIGNDPLLVGVDCTIVC